MNTLLTARLAPAAADVSPLKTFNSGDFSKAPAQSDEFAQTFRSTTEQSQRQSSGEHLPSSGKGGNATPPAHAPVRTSSRTAKAAKAATRNTKAVPATAEAPPPSPLASSAAPVQRPPSQTARSSNAQAPNPIGATAATKQSSPVASPADVERDPAENVAEAVQSGAGNAVPIPQPDASVSAVQPQVVAATANDSIDSGAVNVGANSATPVDVPSRAVTFLAGSVAAATSTPIKPTTPATVGKAAARAPVPQATVDAAPADGAADMGSAATDIVNVPALPNKDPDHAVAFSATAPGTPSPPVVNPMTVNLGEQAAAATQGLAAPVDTKAGTGGLSALSATATRARLGSAAGFDDKEPAAAQQSMPDSSFGAVQALVNANPSTNGTGSTDVTSAPVLNVAQPVESQDFGRGVANQVSVMVDNNLNVAKLQVNPASLGPIEVRIALQAGHAQVWMTSHSAVTRDALQDSASHLKEVLGQQGFGQVSVDISHRQFQERPSQSFTYERNQASEESGIAALTPASAPVSARRSDGKLDAYA